jgi:ribosomal protein S18 acetylase RimI-like enzyme
MDSNALQWKVREFHPADLPICRKLYVEGLLGGKLAENDTGLDIDDIESVYMNTEGNHFWVAENLEGQIVGMIGVQHHDQGVGQVRRLRVAQDYRRRGIGKALLETAISFCRENQYLKVAMDTFAERVIVVEMFQKLGFAHGGTRHSAGRDLLYFYIDLYAGPPRKDKEDGWEDGGIAPMGRA